MGVKIMRYYRVNEVFPELATGGIFINLVTYDMPWSNTIAIDLDLDYHMNVSGDKIISGLVLSLLDSDHKLSNADVAILARVIASRFKTRWTKLYNTMSLEYNPISNYDMVERMTNDRRVTEYGHTDTETNNLSHAKTGTETRTPNTTDTRTPQLNRVTENDVQGFNSDDYVPSEKSTVGETGTDTTTHTGTDTMQYNVTDADTGTRGNVEGGIDTETRNYLLTRSGNIGVTTSQQMIESERELWLWDFFKTVVYPDIDSIITIPIY